MISVSRQPTEMSGLALGAYGRVVKLFESAHRRIGSTFTGEIESFLSRRRGTSQCARGCLCRFDPESAPRESRCLHCRRIAQSSSVAVSVGWRALVRGSEHLLARRSERHRLGSMRRVNKGVSPQATEASSSAERCGAKVNYFPFGTNKVGRGRRVRRRGRHRAEQCC